MQTTRKFPTRKHEFRSGQAEDRRGLDAEGRELWRHLRSVDRRRISGPQPLMFSLLNVCISHCTSLMGKASIYSHKTLLLRSSSFIQLCTGI